MIDGPTTSRNNPEKTVTEGQASQNGKVAKKSWLVAVFDLYIATFSPLLVVLPIMFVHVGILRASVIMFAIWLLQTLTTKLNFESTRLQRENMNLTRHEDFETLISAPRLQGSWLISTFSAMYPMVLFFYSTITIIVCSVMTDEALTAFYFHDQDRDKYLFSILPALDEDRRAV